MESVVMALAASVCSLDDVHERAMPRMNARMEMRLARRNISV